MPRILLIAIGLITTVLAVAGAILPGLPTTPFLLIALWAFSKSSPRLHASLQKIPLLRTALKEAQRFEERRALRLTVKLLALSFAWSSVLLTILLSGAKSTLLIAIVTIAALSATIAMWWIPTDHDNDSSA